jgi:hypothetical protein
MHYRLRSSSNRVLLFALAFVAMQTYVLYASTFHKFHGMPPMCQLCATVEKYENNMVASPIVLYISHSIEDSNEFSSKQITVFSSPPYQPRAPPTLG